MPQIHSTYIKLLDGVPAMYTLLSPGLYRAPCHSQTPLCEHWAWTEGEKLISLNREKTKSQPTRVVVYGIMARS